MATKKTTEKAVKRGKTTHLARQRKVQTAEGWKRSMQKIHATKAGREKK